MKENNLSIDIGGTKTLVWVLDRNLHVHFRKRLATTEFLRGNVDDLGKMAEHISEKLPMKSFDTVGVSCKGNAINGRIRFLSLLGGNVDVDPEEVFGNHLKFRQFIFDNDVISMTKAENAFGMGRRTKNFSLINLGTGMRVVNVVDGKILRGVNGMAGEIGFIEIHDSHTNSIQYFDSLVAGRGLSVLSKLINGSELSAKEIFEKGETNLIGIFTHYLVDLLLQTTYYYNPEGIVFTGSLTKAHEKWLPEVIHEYDNKIFPKLIKPKYIAISKLKDPASLGAVLSN